MLIFQHLCIFFLTNLNQNWHLASNSAKNYIFLFHCPQDHPVYIHVPDQSLKNANMLGNIQKFLGPSGNNQEWSKGEFPNLIHNQLSQMKFKPQISMPPKTYFLLFDSSYLELSCLHLKLQLWFNLPLIIFYWLHKVIHTHLKVTEGDITKTHLPTLEFHKY